MYVHVFIVYIDKDTYNSIILTTMYICPMYMYAVPLHVHMCVLQHRLKCVRLEQDWGPVAALMDYTTLLELIEKL